MTNLDSVGKECIEHFTKINPKGSAKNFIKMAAEFGYKKALKDREELKPGARATYVTKHKTENGIIKSFTPDGDAAFVVYNCGGDWVNYHDYTGARTNLRDLKPGWE